MIPRRARRPAADTPLVHRIASLLLRYPDQTMLACLDDITAALPAIADRSTAPGSPPPAITCDA
jgi:nitrate reductase delta subunit